jgi:hypothetical protein
MIEEIKGTPCKVDDRYGEYELTTKDGYICIFMYDTCEYEYFKPEEVEDA